MPFWAFVNRLAFVSQYFCFFWYTSLSCLTAQRGVARPSLPARPWFIGITFTMPLAGVSRIRIPNKVSGIPFNAHPVSFCGIFLNPFILPSPLPHFLCLSASNFLGGYVATSLRFRRIKEPFSYGGCATSLSTSGASQKQAIRAIQGNSARQSSNVSTKARVKTWIYGRSTLAGVFSLSCITSCWQREVAKRLPT